MFQYAKRVLPEKPSEKERLAILEFKKIKEIFEKRNFENKPCHNDINPGNIFILKDKALFIDWVDAGMSDPFWDLAKTSVEFAFNSKQDEYLLNQYLRTVTELDKSRFFLLKQVFWLKTIDGEPNKEKLAEIKKIFAANDYIIDITNKITWKDLHKYAIDLLLVNSSTEFYKKTINIFNK